MATLRYDAGAAAYDRLTGRWSALFATACLDAVDVASSNRLLDLAAGTGDGALLASRRLASSASTTAVDLSVPMLAVARSKASGQSVDVVAADAQVLPFADGAFDAGICLFGLMFFPEPLRALAEVRRVMRRERRFCATVWSTPEAAPFAGFVAKALSEVLPAERDDRLRPFSMSDPSRVARLLTDAGFEKVAVRRESRIARFSSFDDYWDPVEAGGGRLGQAYLSLPMAQRSVVRQRVQGWLSQHTQGDAIETPLDAYLAIGHV